MAEKKRVRCPYPMSEFYTYEDEVPKGTRVSFPEDCDGCDGLTDGDGNNSCEDSKHCLMED